MSMLSNVSLFRRSRLAMRLSAAGIGGLALFCPLLGLAQPEGPFSGFSGSWRGSGEVVGTNEQHERIVCRAKYLVSSSGDSLSQALVCASDSYRFDVYSDVVAVGPRVRGQWRETTRNVVGDLVGQVTNGHFEGNISGPGFTAEMSVISTGRKQEVDISPHGGDVAKVDIVLSRQSER
jgi:hypothetical protein